MQTQATKGQYLTVERIVQSAQQTASTIPYTSQYILQGRRIYSSVQGLSANPTNEDLLQILQTPLYPTIMTFRVLERAFFPALRGCSGYSSSISFHPTRLSAYSENTVLSKFPPELLSGSILSRPTCGPFSLLRCSSLKPTLSCLLRPVQLTRRTPFCSGLPSDYWGSILSRLTSQELLTYWAS